MTNRRAPERLTTGRRAVRRGFLPCAGTIVIVATTVAATGVQAHGESFAAAGERRPGPGAPDAEMRPTIQYEEALAHARDRIAFAPGDRVKVAFAPRRSDRWQVGGVAPRSLPAILIKMARLADAPDWPKAITTPAIISEAMNCKIPRPTLATAPSAIFVRFPIFGCRDCTRAGKSVCALLQ